MKTASGALISLLASSDQFLYADLFSFTLADGTVLSFTDKDISLTVGGTLYRADQVRFDGMRYKIAIGLDVDEQTINLSYAPTDTVKGLSWAHALRAGVFDGCYLRRSRAFYTSFTAAPVGVVPLFGGRISTIDQVGRMDAQIRVKSLPLLLDTLMPRNTYQTGCIHGLYDSGCGLVKANYAINWSVTGTSTTSTFHVASWTPPLPAALAGNTEGLQIFVQGTVIFTSGQNAGVTRTIRAVANASPSAVGLVYPLDYPPLAGDTFTIYPGCDKTKATCTNRFNNLANNRSFPYTPAAETAY
ncbi:MAG: hypothetical protein JWO51_141 [Rhodospirillales bacterium]|nr:hypothetical protein [Rhodospirillales bacterium]